MKARNTVKTTATAAQHRTSERLTHYTRSLLQQLLGQNAQKPCDDAAQNLVMTLLPCNSPKYHKQNENDPQYTVRLLLSEQYSTRHGGKAPCQCGQAKL